MPGTFPNAETDGRAGDEPFTAYREGDVIAGKYRLTQVLGAGGMGTVWLARNLVLEIDVAIKVLHSDFAGQEEASQRFLHEARATAKLAHPAIVRMHDFGTTPQGHAFIVMEHLKGEPLDGLLERRFQLPPIEAVQLLLPVLEALDVAHGRGIVHRDLKPENILLAPEGDALMPKVVDFGVAKVSTDPNPVPPLADNLDAAVKQRAVRLTQHGVLLGSPQYMSPEQARGAADVDHRADLWSFSVCLYECIHGDRPFDDDALDQLLLRVLIHEPERPPAMDDALWQIVARGLDKNRDHRWQHASELGEALAQWLVFRGVEVDVAGRSVRSRWLGEASLTGGFPPARAPAISHVVLATPQGTPARSAAWLAGVVAATIVVAGVGIWLAMSPDNDVPEAARNGEPTAEPSAQPLGATPPPAPAASITMPEPSAATEAPPPPPPPARTSSTAAAGPRIGPVAPPPPRGAQPAPRPKPGGALPIPDEPDF